MALARLLSFLSIPGNGMCAKYYLVLVLSASISISISDALLLLIFCSYMVKHIARALRSTAAATGRRLASRSRDVGTGLSD